MGEGFKERILAANKKCDSIVEIINADSKLTPKAMYLLIRRYVLIKFFLDDEPAIVDAIDSFEELSELSIQKVLHISKGNLKATDLSAQCGGVSSVIAKKVLLLMAIQKTLGIKFDPMETADAETVRGLSDLIYHIKNNN